MITPINDGDPDRRARQAIGSLETAETGPDDDNPSRRFIRHLTLRRWAAQLYKIDRVAMLNILKPYDWSVGAFDGSSTTDASAVSTRKVKVSWKYNSTIELEWLR